MSDGPIEWYSQMFQGERWDDLRFPAQAINPPGGVSDADVDPNTGLLLFDSGLTEICMGVAQLPHAWREGTAISPHVHWQKTTSASGTVLWRLEYEIVDNGSVAAMDYGTTLDAVTPVAGTPDTDTANNVMISSFGQIDMTGRRVSCLIFWKLSRVGGSDTYGADARLVEFDIHYQADSLGSAELYTKQNTSGIGL